MSTTNTSLTRLDGLIAERDRIVAERNEITDRLRAAEEAVLEERFRGIDRFAEGDVVLVPRKLFGEKKMWPAQIQRVILDYLTGTFRSGEPWENYHISYRVVLRRPDGTFTGAPDVVYHRDVERVHNETTGA